MHREAMGRTILVGEDEPEVRAYLATALRCQGYSVECAEDGDEVLGCLRASRARISAVLLDIIMPRKDGLETLREIRRTDGSLPVIMLSSASTPVSVVDAIRSGATDFLGKPVSHEELGRALTKAIGERLEPVGCSLESPENSLSGDVLFPGSGPMREIHTLIRQIGMSEVPVLIQGETGVGKEILARQIHQFSPRSRKTFLKLNCAVLPSELVESELFGYERGAFTGAFQTKPGMFEMADGGTLLLDEIGDMDFKLQAKLLQVLQDQEFYRLGGKEAVKVDVRVLAATHRDLDEAIASGAFRQDLYYRISVMALKVPALRERKREILPLAEFLANKYGTDGFLGLFTADLKQALLSYEWPGNIRELENVIRRLLIVRDPAAIAAELRQRTRRKLPLAQVGGAAPVRLEPPILKEVTRVAEQAEIEAIRTALNSTQWNRKQAAALLSIDYKALLYRMKRLGISGPSGRRSRVSPSE